MPESEPMETCSIEDCHREKIKRGWCNTHYQRWRNHGDPNFVIKQHHLSPEDSFAYYTIPEPMTGCLLWWGTTTHGGYGVLRIKGKLHRAHRYSWERANGPIPEGLFLDHVCHTTACVNVDHLRFATVAQNGQNRRGRRPNRINSYPRGVYKTDNGKYAARLKYNGNRVWLGAYATPAEAGRAAEAGRSIFFGHYAGGS